MMEKAALRPLREAMKRTAAELAAERSKFARQKKKWDAQERFNVVFLRILWIISAGNPHVMQSAWRLFSERLDSVWHRSDADCQVIWDKIGKDVEEQNMSDEAMFELCHPISKEAVDAWYQAWVFLAEWRLAMAVLSLNVDSKLVATPEEIHARFHQYLCSHHPLVPAVVLNRAVDAQHKRRKAAAQRQWLCRWRERWGFQYRSLPHRSVMQGDEILRKVGRFFWQFWVQKGETKMVTRRDQKRSRFWMPFLGTLDVKVFAEPAAASPIGIAFRGAESGHVLKEKIAAREKKNCRPRQFSDRLQPTQMNGNFKSSLDRILYIVSARCFRKCFCQVMVFLNWSQAAFEIGNASNKKVVAINMDETMIAYGYARRKGTVLTAEFWDDVNDVLLCDGIKGSITKTNMSLSACIASDPEVQKLLPQTLRAKKAKFPLYLQDIADALLPEKVTIELGPSLWTTQESFKEWVSQLNESLQDLKDTHWFILVVDAARCHINEEIANWCYLLGFLMIFVPAGLTWMLQPLDVYVFADLKRRIKDRLHAVRIAQEDGQCPPAKWLPIVMKEVASLNNADYSRPFSRLGLDGEQLNLRVVDHGIINAAHLATHGVRHPTEDELATCLGRKNVPFYEMLMAPFTQERRDAEYDAAGESITDKPLRVLVGDAASSQSQQ